MTTLKNKHYQKENPYQKYNKEVDLYDTYEFLLQPYLRSGWGWVEKG